MESAIADVQLFGSAVQVNAAHRFASEMAGQRGSSLDELLSSPRNELKEGAQLEPIQGKLIHLRIVFDNDQKKDPGSLVTSRRRRLFNDHTMGLEYGVDDRNPNS